MNLAKEKVILASNSPRRKELLGVITADFTVCPSLCEENVPENISPFETAEYLARLKALEVASRYKDAVVLGADTCVLAENRVLGKPKDRDEAKRMLKLLSGKTHSVVTGCAVVKKGNCQSFSVETKVEFYSLSEKEIEDYVSSSEPYDKAGGYGIQGKASLFVKGIIGDYFNVVGLPIAELNRVLKDE